MKRVPRNKAIDIVVQGHIADIETWVNQGQREDLKRWLYKTLGLSRKSVDDMISDYGSYFDLIDYEDEDE